jgi:aspartate kinase
MSLIVQKFGGTSVANAEKMRVAARRAIRAQQNGNQVVMVVSAMGHQTDHLVDLAKQVSEDPAGREMDMLLSTGEQVSVALMAMAIHSLGSQAVSLTGAQIGIRTDSSHTKARIQSISTDRMRKLLDDGNIVIAAGFQGIDEDFNITTLGRGGSDTTAVALAAVLNAAACEIYTDVDGVFTTDPRLLPEARKMDRVSHEEILELASLGAGVMHSRSIEFGKKFNVPIHVRNSQSFSDDPGTVIGRESESADRAVSGAALTKNEAQITIAGVPDHPGTSYAIFSKLAGVNVAVDMIVQNAGADGSADISFTVLEDDLPKALAVSKKAADELRAESVSHDASVSKVSIVGLGMATQTGVADRMFRALSDEGINIEAITTSEIKVSVLVKREQALAALRAVHSEFELDRAPNDRVKFGEATGKQNSIGGRANPVDIVARLQRMEDLTIESVSLDESQAQMTLFDVPDRPGVSARIFEAVASEGILVDMIVQSIGRDELADISFTVPRTSVEQSRGVLKQLSAELGGEVKDVPAVAILTVNGIGIRSHTGVGLRMFKALAEAKINVEMVSTSEIRVNVVVGADKGEAGLAALKAAFADVLG